MELFVVIEQEGGEVQVTTFDTLELAEEYVDEHAVENVRIEHHNVNVGWIGNVA